MLCPCVLFAGMFSLKSRSIVLLGVVDAVVVQINNVMELVGCAMTFSFCFFLSIKLGRKKKPSSF